MLQAKVSAQQQYLAYIQADTNELHVLIYYLNIYSFGILKEKQNALRELSLQNKMRLSRQTRNRINNSSDSPLSLLPIKQLSRIPNTFTQNDYVLVAGLSDGSIQVIDCASAQVLKDLPQVNGHASINAVTFYRKEDSMFKLLISSEDSYIVYDFQKQTVLESIISSQQKKKSNPTPTHIDISFDDLYSIEGYLHQINLRNLKTKQVLAKFEGHQYNIKNLSFALNSQSYVFVSAANSECLMWSPREYIKNQSLTVQDISQPDKILDLGSSDMITSITVKEIEDHIFIASISTDSYTNVYFTKCSGNSTKKTTASKNLVKKRESQIKLSNANHQMISAIIGTQSQLNILHGSIFAIKKSLVPLTNDQGKLEKEIVLGKVNDDEERKNLLSKKKQNQVDGYNVLGIEEEGNAKVNGIIQHRQQSNQFNLSLLPDHDLDHLESKMTSVSSKKHSKPVSGSLSVILSQALTADDSETLEWILSQKDQQMITSTLVNLKDHRHLSALFKQIVIRFQQEGGSSAGADKATLNQQSIVMWLKTLLALHWPALIKKADKDDLKNLGAIQSYIQKKTKYMDKILLLKGKLEMLQNTIELRKQASQGKSVNDKSGKSNQPMLVYKDADDDEDEIMKEDNEDDEEDNEESEDEEIREIDIKNRKRAKKDGEDEDDEDVDGDLDDSIDEESKNDDEIGEDEDEEIDSDLYGGESDEDDDDIEKLAQDSDNGDVDMEEEEDDEESEEQQVIKSKKSRR